MRRAAGHRHDLGVQPSALVERAKPERVVHEEWLLPHRHDGAGGVCAAKDAALPRLNLALEGIHVARRVAHEEDGASEPRKVGTLLRRRLARVLCEDGLVLKLGHVVRVAPQSGARDAVLRPRRVGEPPERVQGVQAARARADLARLGCRRYRRLEERADGVKGVWAVEAGLRPCQADESVHLVVFHLHDGGAAHKGA
eukprot:2879021-Prymnesium_polylepis.1